MKNTKEIKAILAAVYCINRTAAKDEDIEKILQYAFQRILESSANLLALCCAGKTKEDVMPELEMLLGEDTKYLEYKKFKEKDDV